MKPRQNFNKASYVNSNSRDKRRGIYTVQKTAEGASNTVSEVGGEETMSGTLGGMDQDQAQNFQ